MALNYANQFKFTGNGYLDKKMQPVNTLDELKAISKMDILSYYQHGMKVTVLNDEPFGEVDYVLNENGEWQRLIDFEQLKIVVDKGNYENDEKEERYIQLEYKGNVLGSPVNLSPFFSDIENRLEVLENKGNVEDTNTFVESAEIVTEFDGQNGLFIKFVYNDGNVFYTDITTLEPKSYESGVGILIGDDNVIGINETWFETWFEERVSELNKKLSSLEDKVGKVELETKSLSERLNEIATRGNKNTEDIANLSERLLNIAGLEKLQAGDNVSLVSKEDGSVVLSVDFSKIPTVDTTEIENRLDVLEERIDSISGNEGDVAVDNETIVKNEDKTLSVKISQKEGNTLVKEEDGLFSQGIYITGDDNEEIE
jgi:hypothetical protein